MIYFDNAATSLPKPKAVTEAVAGAMNFLGNAHRWAAGPSADASFAIYGARECAAAFFGVEDPLNVAFTSGATESLSAIILGQFKPGDHVITTELEHNSVLRPLYKSGAELSFVPYGEHNDVHAFESLLRTSTKAVVCTHASNVTGDMVDIYVLGKFCKAHGLLFILDASQTAGFAQIDMKKAEVDVLCFTGHKSLLGPQGVGGICVSQGPLLKLAPLKTGGSGFATFSHELPASMPTCFEAGTPNAAGIAGLRAGMDFIQQTGLENINDHDTNLCRRALDGLGKIDGITVYGDFSSGLNRAPVISFNLGGLDSGDVSSELWDSYGIATRSGFHCAPLIHMALGTALQGAVRISFSWFNTLAEVDIFLNSLSKIAVEFN